MKVHKYLLNGQLNEPIMVLLPVGAKVLTFGIDEYKQTPALWAAFDDERGLVEEVCVLITGTGFITPTPRVGFVWEYVNTYKTNLGLMVWHAFVEKREA